MARIQGIDLPKNKRGVIGLTYIYGIGSSFAKMILDEAKVSYDKKIQDWTDDESKPLLDYLYNHATKPEFTCRFEWKAGSIAFWDNRATWHLAINDYHGEKRLMHRITIDGTKLN